MAVQKHLDPLPMGWWKPLMDNQVRDDILWFHTQHEFIERVALFMGNMYAALKFITDKWNDIIDSVNDAISKVAQEILDRQAADDLINSKTFISDMTITEDTGTTLLVFTITQKKIGE